MNPTSCYICKSPSSSLLWNKNGFKIRECRSCSFIYVSPLPSKRATHDLYDKFDYKNPEEAKSSISKDARHSLSIIEKYSANRGKMLDVGCGRGYFLDEARRRGWETYGIDYSSKIVDCAKNILSLNVVVGDIFSFSAREKFKVLTLNQVIEHVFQPLELVNKLKELLSDNGLIYVVTPNIRSLAARVAGEHFDFIEPPMHLSYFSPRTLHQLFSNNGFKIIYSGSWSYPHDLAGIIKRLTKRDQELSDLKSGNDNATQFSISKKIKYFLFDKLFCGTFYRFLNVAELGTHLEIIAARQ